MDLKCVRWGEFFNRKTIRMRRVGVCNNNIDSEMMDSGD